MCFNRTDLIPSASMIGIKIIYAKCHFQQYFSDGLSVLLVGEKCAPKDK